MSYTIHNSDGTVLTSLADQTIDTSTSPIALVGRNAQNYGQAFAENFVHIVQNFCSATAPTSPLLGQFWFNSASNTLNIYAGSSVWVAVVNFTAGSSTVSGNQVTSTAPNGTAPFVVTSKTKVANLNCDYLDGYDTFVGGANTTVTPNTVAIRDANGDLWANVFHGTATSAQYGDLAERFEASEALAPGDIVTVGGSKEIRKASINDAVLGVISAQPGVRMNEGAGPDSTHPFVAYQGRVPVYVTGQVAKGQSLFVCAPGVASAEAGGAYVGTALESKSTADLGTVLAVVGR